MIGGIAARSSIARRFQSLRMPRQAQHKLFHPRCFASGTAPDDKTLSIWYPVLGGLVITIAGGAKYWHDHVGGFEGIQRSATFYSYAIPKYILYRYHVWKQSPDEVWDAMDRETSQGALKKIQELRGFYIKSGQLAAANVGDGLYGTYDYFYW